MKAAVIIQARMNSSRLPGKVLMQLEGKSVLAHVIERCKVIPGTDVVCVATVDGPESDGIVIEAHRNGAEVFRGSESDVLERYYLAAKSLDADIILRVTSDSPLLDPEIYGRALNLLKSSGADYVANNLPPSWPHGLDCEAFTFAWLERAALEATKPSEREHVTPWIREHPDVKKQNLVGPHPSCNHYRWTLDTQEDFDMMETLFWKLPEGLEGWNWRVTKDIVDATTGLRELNANYDPLEGLKKSHEDDEAWARDWLTETGPSETYEHLASTPDLTDKTGRQILSLRRQDLLPIMNWRNDQIDVLRQAKPLTPTGQKSYYENVIRPTFGEETPAQILVSYLLNGTLIGYGGLTNINWQERSAEVSFLLDTERSNDIALHCQDFRHFLKLLQTYAFDGLKLDRLHTETYDIRPHHVEVLETAGFKPQGRLPNRVIIEGKPTDSLLHASVRQAG